MEDGLGVTVLKLLLSVKNVLILVLVEDGLGGEGTDCITDSKATGLNPCFGGRWSRSRATLHRFL